LGKLIIISVGLPKELYEALLRATKENGYATKQEVIRDALREFLYIRNNTAVRRVAVYQHNKSPKLPHGDRL
jgi:metal-responsive CopG/Arc/MetJ family transcriptional regulator